jgi:hypothetical protein
LKLLSRIDLLQRKIVKNSFKKFLIGATSGALVLSFSASPASASSSLYSLGGAAVSGTFSVNSTITATPNQWSLTEGGAAVTSIDSYDWYVCTIAQTTSTTKPAEVPCVGNNNYQKILADGTVGAYDAPSPLTGSSLAITQNLLTALAGKYLMVSVNGRSSNVRGGVFLQSCGPISTGLTCSVSVSSSTSGGTTSGGTTSGGTTSGGGAQETGSTLPAQALAKKVPAKAKAGKTITIAAVTNAKVATKVTVKGKGCKVAAVKDKKNKKKIASYKVTMGKKGVTCTVTVTAPATTKVAALNSVTPIKVS